MLSKAQAKKVKGRYQEEQHKQKAAAEREVNCKQNQSLLFFFFFPKEKDRQTREENLKKAKEITITEDTSLPKAKVVCSISCFK